MRDCVVTARNRGREQDARVSRGRSCFVMSGEGVGSGFDGSGLSVEITTKNKSGSCGCGDVAQLLYLARARASFFLSLSWRFDSHAQQGRFH